MPNYYLPIAEEGEDHTSRGVISGGDMSRYESASEEKQEKAPPSHEGKASEAAVTAAEKTG